MVVADADDASRRTHQYIRGFAMRQPGDSGGDELAWIMDANAMQVAGTT